MNSVGATIVEAGLTSREMRLDPRLAFEVRHTRSAIRACHRAIDDVRNSRRDRGVDRCQRVPNLRTNAARDERSRHDEGCIGARHGTRDTRRTTSRSATTVVAPNIRSAPAAAVPGSRTSARTACFRPSRCRAVAPPWAPVDPVTTICFTGGISTPAPLFDSVCYIQYSMEPTLCKWKESSGPIGALRAMRKRLHP